MAIRIGIYDFFAYTVPGGLMILLGLVGVHWWAWPEIWNAVRACNTLEIIVLIIGAYLLGLITEPILTKWSDLFERGDLKLEITTRLQKRYPHLSLSINYFEWPLWFASIRRESLDLALEIDRWMAVAKMLRGVSFALLLGGILCLITVLGGKISWIWLTAAFLLFIMAFLSVKQSLKFRTSFFQIIFETIISRQEPFTPNVKLEKDKSVNLAKKEQ